MADRISEALFGRTRRRVLALLFGQPDKSFYLREIVRLTNGGTGAVQRELGRLLAAGLIRRTPRGQQVYFSADPRSPVFGELSGLLDKTAGIAGVLRPSLLKFAKKKMIRIAFIYGSVAKGKHTSESDIDLVILGHVKLSDLLPAIRPLEQRLGREINPTVYSPEDFTEKLRKQEHFISRVAGGPKIMLIGSNDDLEGLVRESLADEA